MSPAPIVLLVAATLATSLSGCAAGQVSPLIAVSAEHCGAGWTQPHSGQQTFVVTNDDIASGELYLTDAKSGDVYAYVDDLAPGSRANLSIDLGSGHYAFRCAISDRGVATGPTVTVGGHVAGGPAPVAPVSEQDLIPLTQQYQGWVSGRLAQLQPMVAALDADIRAGDYATARADWVAAHDAWSQLGAAYDAFGDDGTAIDGTADSLPLGDADPAFTGFHRVEYGLWHGEAVNTLVRFADRLETDVAQLAGDFGGRQIEPLDLSIRAHEIVEDALRLDLDGTTDYGSGSTLATVDAELTGTTVILDLLKPILRSRYPGLAQTDRDLAIAQSDVRANAAHPLVVADISRLAADLAPVASICEPRRTS